MCGRTGETSRLHVAKSITKLRLDGCGRWHRSLENRFVDLYSYSYYSIFVRKTEGQTV